MAVFIGDNKNNFAVRAAMEISWASQQVIWPAIQAAWNDTARWGWSLGHGVGVDTGDALLIRTGVRGDNDIASIGNAPNVAAKLSEMRQHGGPIFITKAVFDDLDVAYTHSNGTPMWAGTYNASNIGGTYYTVYRTHWWYSPD